ncbi:MAG: TetR/AcrR family transcriptional regulator [Thermoleophilia bacterium]
MPPTPERPRRRGRPRDPALDGRILAAAREVVAEGGVCSASITAIAERAGVGKPTVYLRWGNAVEVITAAFEEMEWTDEVGARFRAAVAAIDALAEVPDGRFLVEVVALSAQERLGWLADPHRRLSGPG